MQVHTRTRTKSEAQYVARSLRGSYTQVNVVPDRESLFTKWVVVVEPKDLTEYCEECRKYHAKPTWPNCSR